MQSAQACSTTYASRLRADRTSLISITSGQTRTRKQYLDDIDSDNEHDDDTPPVVSEIKAKRAPVVYSNSFTGAIPAVPEALVPIRINIEYDNMRIDDFFCWNLYESQITPERFSQIMCIDMDLPATVANQIATAIKTQLDEYAPVVGIDTQTVAAAAAADTEFANSVVPVQVSLHLSKYLFEDKFEWDIGSDELQPEQFAKIVCQDMSLSSEFYPAISHAVHESLLRLKKDFVSGEAAALVNQDNQAAYGARAGWRLDAEGLCSEWAPSIEVLSKDEIEKREGERERNIRRLRRESARFGSGRRRTARPIDPYAGTPRSRPSTPFW
ncbi:hypothetical protein CANCADRAFT_140214 [Tortispora caseinolytica NRRL Y-17796]|uniref:Uncharacterized protein n=1 Tax=Tortispora caseinolytica NRRL Y-17796 TaxID=767744 RepID=A0A1E4TCN0_9ASCO|nr:hypothetical protein CANCADRAFT_140214 [Tortispora caseinolytica NRRL Y-17796]